MKMAQEKEWKVLILYMSSSFKIYQSIGLTKNATLQ